MRKESIKTIIISAIIIAFCLILGLGTAIFASKNTSKVPHIAFYNLPENVEVAIKNKLQEVCPPKTTFTSITEAQFSAKKLIKKYTFVFALDGSAIDELSQFTKPLQKDIFQEIPTSIAPKNADRLPLLLDHWELSYYVKAMENSNLSFPTSLFEFQNLLINLKSQVFVPFYCNGGYNSDLLALISSITEATGGTEAYKNLVTTLKADSNLSNVIDLNLLSDNSQTVTLRDTLDLLRYWVSEGLLYENWLQAKNSDLISIGKQRQLGVFFTTLSNHRQIPFEIINRFSADRMPVTSVEIDHSLIAPSIVCLKLCKSGKFDYIMKELVEKQTQKELSAATMLAPVNQFAQSVDKQADDVRFLAAACDEGQTSDISTAVFQTNSEAMANFAEDVRFYLTSGKIR